MNRSVYLLKSFEEAVGLLSEVIDVDGIKTATIGGVCVALPDDIASVLLTSIGKRVGVLRTDRDYRIKVSEESDAR